MRQLVRGHRTGDRDGERSLDVHVALHGGPAVHAGAGVACRELEHVRPRRDRSQRRSVERARVAVARDDKPGDPAEAASDRRGHAEGERGRECRVQRVPAFAQELDAGLGRARIRGDHAFGRDRLGPREDPLAPLCHDQPGTGAPTKINWGPGGVAPDDGGRSPPTMGGGAPTSVLFAACPWTWPTSSPSRPSPTSSSRPTATASPSS